MLLLEGRRVEIRLRPTCGLLQPILVQLPGDIVAKLPGDVGGKIQQTHSQWPLKRKNREIFYNARLNVKSDNCLAAAKSDDIAWQRQPWQDCPPPLLLPGGFALQALQSWGWVSKAKQIRRNCLLKRHYLLRMLTKALK